jgi:very-short-patch-repair endonuclease
MPRRPDVPSAYGTLRRDIPREVALAALADRQHGVVSLAQLEALGLSASAVRGRVASGRLHGIHRGVYAVGRARLTRDGRSMAAVLACGPEAVLSHRSAAAHWGLIADNRAVSDVSVPRSGPRRRMGIVVPAVEQAGVLRLFDLRAIEALLARVGNHAGAGALGGVLAGLEEPTLTRSDAEEAFLALCRAGSLPSPTVNRALVVDQGAPIEADFLWRRERLAVEVDAFGTQGGPQAFERDRLRDQRLRLAGYEPVRFTRRQIVREPERVRATILELHARAAAR